MQADKQTEVLELLEAMIAIPSVNPAYEEGAEGEMELSRFIEQRCRAAGLSVYRQPVLPNRDNLIIELKTGHPQRTLLFEAHMDTVSLGGMPNPLQPRREGNRLYGRGACDTKGALAAMLHTMEYFSLHREELQADLLMCASVDEEHAYRGLLAFMDLDLPVQGAVVGEPTNLDIVIAHKGCVRFEVETLGKAAHSSVPWEGRNAITDMMKVMEYLERSKGDLERKVHPLCGAPTLSVGTIHGGSQINIVPDQCVIKVDRRLIPGERPDIVLNEIRKELAAFLHGQNVQFAIHELLLDEALDTPPESEVVRSALAAAGRLGTNTALCGASYGSDASKLQQRKGIPSIVFGPGSIQQAHTDEEWVPMDEVELAAEFYKELARQFGKSPRR